MSDPNRSWLHSRHLARTPEGQAARAGLHDLPATRRATVVATGDTLATHSVTLAHRYLLAAVAAAGVPDHLFADWNTTLLELLGTHGEGRAVIEAFLDLPIAALWSTEPTHRQAWLNAATSIAGRSRRLAATFVSVLGRALCATERLDERTIQAWREAVEKIVADGGWRGEMLASALLDDATRLAPVLSGPAVHSLANLIVRVGVAGRSPRLIPVPPRFERLSQTAQTRIIETCRRVADKDVSRPELLFGRLAEAIERLSTPSAKMLLDIVADCLDEPELDEAIPVVPAICHGLDDDTLAALLRIGTSIASETAAGAVAYLRTMDRALERGGIEGIRLWAERGIDVARSGREAAIAHFRLRSRTSRKILVAQSTAVTFEEIQPVLQRFAVMVSRRNLHLTSGPGLWLRPPILPGDELVVRLPERVDLWPTSEDNQMFYKMAVAHAAGRWEYGTYRLRISGLRAHGTWLPSNAPPDGDLVAFLESFPNPLLAAGLFVMLDGIRVDAALGREFPGLAADLSRLGRDYVSRMPPVASERSAERLIETLFLVSVGRLSEASLPARTRSMAPLAYRARRVLERQGRSVIDSARLTVSLYGMLALADAREADDEAETVPLVELGGATFLDEADSPIGGPGDHESRTDGNLAGPFDVKNEPEESSIVLALDEDGTVDGSAGTPLSPEELERLIRQGLDLHIGQGQSSDQPSLGLFITDLLGKLPRATAEQLQEILARGDETALRTWISAQRQGRFHSYDEWDYLISDYRHRWCRVAEIEVAGDGGHTFHRLLAASSELVSRLKREFLLMRPDQFRRIRGMEDGEEFDLNAVVDAKVDVLRRKTPSDRLYVARRREERDVATLFLIDMSASTDEPLADSQKRVIDVTKETLVVMTSVLEEIGDAYAVYGFSGHGRNGVEIYQIKTFQERLGPAVRGRVGAIEPKRSTRMGAALRHVVTKFGVVSARARHIILLSDGFPQDFDYGDDRTSNTYGIRDTTKALQEIEASGVKPFCITIDPSGHDYLRQMCAPSRYAVIDDIATLPEELPRIYQSVVGRA